MIYYCSELYALIYPSQHVYKQTESYAEISPSGWISKIMPGYSQSSGLQQECRKREGF